MPASSSLIVMNRLPSPVRIRSVTPRVMAGLGLGLRRRDRVPFAEAEPLPDADPLAESGTPSRAALGDSAGDSAGFGVSFLSVTRIPSRLPSRYTVIPLRPA